MSWWSKLKDALTSRANKQAQTQSSRRDKTQTKTSSTSTKTKTNSGRPSSSKSGGSSKGGSTTSRPSYTSSRSGGSTYRRPSTATSRGTVGKSRVGQARRTGSTTTRPKTTVTKALTTSERQSGSTAEEKQKKGMALTVAERTELQNNKPAGTAITKGTVLTQKQRKEAQNRRPKKTAKELTKEVANNPKYFKDGKYQINAEGGKVKTDTLKYGEHKEKKKVYQGGASTTPRSERRLYVDDKDKAPDFVDFNPMGQTALNHGIAKHQAEKAVKQQTKKIDKQVKKLEEQGYTIDREYVKELKGDIKKSKKKIEKQAFEGLEKNRIANTAKSKAQHNIENQYKPKDYGKLKSEQLTAEDYLKLQNASRLGGKLGNKALGKDLAEKVGSRTAYSAGKNTISKVTTGAMQGLAYGDVLHGGVGTYNKDAKKVLKEVKESGAYNLGYAGGQMAGFALSGTNSLGKSAATTGLRASAKAIAKAEARNAGQQFMRSRAAEMAIETPMNLLDAVKMSRDENGKVDKKQLTMYMSLNTALTGVAGGAMEGIGMAMTRAEGKTYADLLAKSKAGTLTTEGKAQLEKLQNKLVRATEDLYSPKASIANDALGLKALDKNENKDLIRLTYKGDTSKLTEQESKRLKEITDKSAALEKQNDAIRADLKKSVEIKAQTLNKLSKETGVEYVYTNNDEIVKALRESGKTVEDDVFVNGVTLTKDGKRKIYINSDSDQAHNIIVGHETTHLLSGTEHFDALKNSVKEYAENLGDYEALRNTFEDVYDSEIKSMSKEEADAFIDEEVTAELVGRYLFGENGEDFVRHLSMKDRNVFQRMYDYIVNAIRNASGDAELRQLNAIKDNFDKAYKELGETPDSLRAKTDGVDFSKSKIEPSDIMDSNGKVTKEASDAYMRAAETGDTALAEKMVQAKAKNNPTIAKTTDGDPLHLYHGTRNFGFTEYKDDFHDTPFIYTSTNSTVSAHYAGDNNYAFKRQIGKPYKESDNVDDIIENAKTVYGVDYKVMTPAEKEARYNEVKSEASKVADRFEELYDDMRKAGETPKWDERTGTAIDYVEQPFFIARDGDGYNFHEDDGWRDSFVSELNNSIEEYKEFRGIVSDYLNANRNSIGPKEKSLLQYLCGYDVGDNAIDIECGMARVATEEPRLIRQDGMGVTDPKELKKAMDQTHKIGAYDLYGDIGDRPFEFDANGSQFWDLHVPEMGEKSHTTDAVAKWAHENGYTSVIMHNIYDYGDKADNYVFFNSKQIKSADPVTYDNAGKVIPLSERFNTESPDMRFSIVKKVTDTDGNAHENVVKLDTDLFKAGEPKAEKAAKLHNFVYDNFAGRRFTAYDDSGNPVDIEFARVGEKHKKISAKRSQKTLDEIADKPSYGERRFKTQKAAAQADELIEVSRYSGESANNVHGKLDKNGWEYRTLKVMDDEGNLNNCVLSIAKTEDGRNLLYDIKIKEKIGQVSKAADSDLPESPIFKKSVPEPSPEVKAKFSKSKIEPSDITDSNGNVTKAADDAYMYFATNGDEKAAQKMVDARLESQGYTYDIYHGTDRFGYTEFDLDSMDDGMSIFASSSPDVAGSYTRGGLRRISDKRVPEFDTNKADELIEILDDNGLDDLRDTVRLALDDADKGESDNLISLYDDVDLYMQNGKNMWDEYMDKQGREIPQSVVDEIYSLAQDIDSSLKVPEAGGIYHGKAKLKNPLVVHAPEESWNSIPGYTFKESDDSIYARSVLEKFDDEYDEYINDIINEHEEYTSELVQLLKEIPRNPNAAFDYVKRRDEIIKKLYADKEALPKYKFADSGKSKVFSSQSEVEDILDTIGADDTEAYTTRDVAEYARENGYDGVVLEGIYDTGKYGLMDAEEGKSNIYILFDSNQFKSADPITRDDAGNIIPLSKRGTSDEADIRFSKSKRQKKKQAKKAEEYSPEKAADIEGLEAAKSAKASAEEKLTSLKSARDAEAQAGEKLANRQRNVSKFGKQEGKAERLNEIKAKKAESDSKLAQLDKDIESATKELDKAQASIDSYAKNESVKPMGRKEKTAAKVDRLKSEIDGFNTEIKDIRKAITAKNAEIRRLDKVDYGKMSQKEMDAHLAKRNKVVQEVNDMRQNITDLRSRIESRQKDIGETGLLKAQKNALNKPVTPAKRAEAKRAQKQALKEAERKDAIKRGIDVEAYEDAKVPYTDVTTLSDKQIERELNNIKFANKNAKTPAHTEIRNQRKAELVAEKARRKEEGPRYAALRDDQLSDTDPGWTIKRDEEVRRPAGMSTPEDAPTAQTPKPTADGNAPKAPKVKPKTGIRAAIDNKTASFRRLFVSSLTGFEDTARSLKDQTMRRELNNAITSVQQINNRVSAFVEKGRTSFDRKQTGISLNEIFDKHHLFKKENQAKLTDFTNYLTYKHAIDRLDVGKPVHLGDNGLSLYTKEDYREMMDAITRDMSDETRKQLDEFETDIRGYFNDLQQYRVDSGQITPEFREYLDKTYPNYVPTYREGDEFLQSELIKSKSKKASVKQSVNVATGGQGEIQDLWSQMVSITHKTIAAGEENNLINVYCKAKKIPTDLVPKDVTLDDVFETEIGVKEVGRGQYRVEFFTNGKPMSVVVDKQIAKGLREINGQEFARLMDAMSHTSGAMRAFKGPITDYNLIFGVKNVGRDTQQAVVNSKDTLWYTKSVPSALSSIANKDSVMRKLYEMNGGYHSSMVLSGKNISMPGSKGGVKGAAKTAFDNTLGRIEEVNNLFEMGPRMCEFIGTLSKHADEQLKANGSSLKQLRNEIEKEMFPGGVKSSEGLAQVEEEFMKRIADMADKDVIDAAARNAADITLNFSRNGVVTKALNMGAVPYMNPAIQGISKTARMFTESNAEGILIPFLAKLGTITALPAVANEYLCAGNRDYQNLNARDKDANFFIPIGDGRFIKLPKPRENAALVLPVEYGMRWMLEKASIGEVELPAVGKPAIEQGEYGKWKDLGQMFTSGLDLMGPANPLTENIYSPITRLWKNETWYSGAIESTSEVLRKKDGELKNSEIMDESTSALAKWIGQKKIGNTTVSDLTHLSPKKIDNLMDSYLGVIYDMGISQTADAKHGNPILNQFVTDSLFSNKNGTELWAEFDKANAPKDTKGKVIQKGKDIVFGHNQYNINEKSQEAKDWLNLKGYDDITYSDALNKILYDKKLTDAERKKYQRVIKKAQNDLRHELVYGAKEVKPGMDPIRTIAKLFGVNKAMKKFTYTYTDPETGEKINKHLDAWKAYKQTEEYKNDKVKGGEKFLDFYTKMRWTNGRIGESKAYPSWMTAAVIAATEKGNNKALAGSYIKPPWDKDGTYAQSIIDRGENYKNAGYTQGKYRRSQKAIFNAGRKLGYDYTNQMNPWDKAMALSTNKKHDFSDGAYYAADTSGKVSRRMNYARCLDAKGYTTKQIYKFAKEYDIKLPKTDNMSKDQYVTTMKAFNAKVERAVKDKYGDRPLEEQAAVYHVITDDLYNKPFGDVGDYGKKKDTGITDLDKKPSYGGWGYGGGYGGHGWGGGGWGGWGGGSGGASSGVGAVFGKPKVTDAKAPKSSGSAPKGSISKAKTTKIKMADFSKVSVGDYRTPSNLNDAYRKKAQKLREASRTRKK